MQANATRYGCIHSGRLRHAEVQNEEGDVVVRAERRWPRG